MTTLIETRPAETTAPAAVGPSYAVVPIDGLEPYHWAAWTRIVESQPRYGSPYFRPQFARELSRFRDDVEVGVLESGGMPVGFLPFHRRSGNVGVPLGENLSDFHAVVVRDDVAWSADELLEACGLKAFRFDHLLADQEPFANSHVTVEDSPYLDLGEGFEAYCAERRQATKRVKRALKKGRQLGRDVGPLSVEPTDDPAVFEALLEWKSAQYRRTGVRDVFASTWVREFLRRLVSVRGEAFGGVLMTLRAGGTLVAVELGMRARGTFHSWFPAFDPEYGRYSPGSVLLLEFARQCEEFGVERIDLGKGDLEYKQAFASGAVPVAEGIVDRRPLRRAVTKGWLKLRDRLRNSRLHPVIRGPVRTARSLRQTLFPK